MKRRQISHSSALFLTNWQVAGTTTRFWRHCQQKCLEVLHQTNKVSFFFFQNGVQTAEYKHLHRALCTPLPHSFVSQFVILHLTPWALARLWKREPSHPWQRTQPAVPAQGWSMVGSRLWHSRLCPLAAPSPAEPGDSCLRKPGRSCCERALSCIRCSWFSWHLLLSSHRGISQGRQRFPGFPYRNKSL